MKHAPSIPSLPKQAANAPPFYPLSLTPVLNPGPLSSTCRPLRSEVRSQAKTPLALRLFPIWPMHFVHLSTYLSIQLGLSLLTLSLQIIQLSPSLQHRSRPRITSTSYGNPTNFIYSLYRFVHFKNNICPSSHHGRDSPQARHCRRWCLR